jgi:L-arabinose isomerase
MNAFDQYEVWFVTGAQLLYGGDRRRGKRSL